MTEDYQTKNYNDLKQSLMVYQEDLSNLTSQRIGEFLLHHYNNQRQRLIKLDSYYKGVNTEISREKSRRLDDGGADVRLSHPFAQEIADFHTSFSVGNPINISVDSDDNGQEDEHPLLDKINDVNDVDALFYDLFADMSKFGRAYANVFRDPNEKIERIVRLNPINTFMIYSKDIDPKPVMAVRYTPQQQVDTVSGDLLNSMYIVETWTDGEYRQSQPIEIGASILENGWAVDDTQDIVSLPVVEFWNNSQRMGDYEGVISLIDAYDASQSDTANYMQDSNDAMLVIQGDINDLLDGIELAANPEDKEYLEKVVAAKKDMIKQIRESRTLFLKSGISGTGAQTNVSASYIHKEYDAAGVEAYKNRLFKNIHTFSRTPDVSDENFASNASGVAMQYKQLGVIQLAKTKRRMFEKGLSAIYGIIQDLELAVSGAWNINSDDIKFMFTDNTPTDDVNTIQLLNQAGASFPQAYLDKYAPGIDAQQLGNLREQQDQAMADMQEEMTHIKLRQQAVDSDDEEVTGDE
ncbi:phage portal protein [Convivina praedatoris]|uniref:phage portal protein n=1 Tax=Convivina praedatoris TaxID=2880963 RepID=UPI00200BE134|nr:phage portal protein [Convivina sp. LMG 32447]CAH1857154.1 hypothetical protein R078138_01517 [Convivina sp. LMG 32447]